MQCVIRPVGDGENLFVIQYRLFFAAKSVLLCFLFKQNKRAVAVIVADAELFPAVYTVKLFPQRLVGQIVKIQTADLVDSVDGVFV